MKLNKVRSFSIEHIAKSAGRYTGIAIGYGALFIVEAYKSMNQVAHIEEKQSQEKERRD